jgi:hypothetical protein
LAVRDLSVAEVAWMSTGQAPRVSPMSASSQNSFTASCASSPAARTNRCRVPSNSEAERASSVSRTGSAFNSAPVSSTRSPGSASCATRRSAAAEAPASSGPQKKNTAHSRAARGAIEEKSRWVAFTPKSS